MDCIRPDISFLVLARNGENGIADCVRSITTQSAFSRCEVLLVDRGDSDEITRSIQHLVTPYPNVRSICVGSVSWSEAKNRAISAANGKYIMFCAPDRTLSAESVVDLLYMIETGVHDIIVGNAAWADGVISLTPPTVVEDSNPNSKLILDRWLRLLSVADPHSLLYSADTIRQTGYRYGDELQLDDLLFTISLLLNVRSIVITGTQIHEQQPQSKDSKASDEYDRYKCLATIELLEHLSFLRADLRPVQRDLLDRSMVRRFEGYAVRISSVFINNEIDEIVDRCHQVFSKIDSNCLQSSAVDTRHILPFLAFMLNQPELLLANNKAVPRLYYSESSLYLDLPVPSNFRHLTKVSRASAFVEQCHVIGDKVLEISGRFLINGLPAAVPPEVDLRLKLTGHSISVPATVVNRPDLAALRADLRWTGFTALVPISDIQRGQHKWRLIVSTSTGDASLTCRPSPAFLATARTIRGDSFRMLNSVAGRNEAALSFEHGRHFRYRWALRQLAWDIRHVWSRKPFWMYRLARMATLPFMWHRKIWLLGERSDTAQDNGWHLFKFLRSVERRKDVYYVLQRDSPDWGRVQSIGNIIRFDSLRHKFLLLHARRLISAYSIDSYMLPRGWPIVEYLRYLNWRVGARRVFLQHGVTHNDVSSALHRARTGLDLVVAAAHGEHRYFADDLNHRDGAQLLGFPRFDRLSPINGQRRVLFMPTWRRYLVSPSYLRGRSRSEQNFEGSRYQHFLLDLLGSLTLREALNEFGYVLDFLPHYEMREVASQLIPKVDGFNIVDTGRTTVQEALRRCSLYVTDWSSPSFDVAYMGKPVIYAQFDPDDFYGSHYRRSYFDGSSKLSGLVAFSDGS